MKKVIRYLAKDGQEFISKSECAEYDKALNSIEKVNALLHPTPDNDGCAFANGRGYIQQDLSKLEEFKRSTVELFKKEITTPEYLTWADEVLAGKRHISYIGRVACDSGSPVYNLMMRIFCTDAKGREWGQPYYANHPEDGVQICLNK